MWSQGASSNQESNDTFLTEREALLGKQSCLSLSIQHALPYVAN